MSQETESFDYNPEEEPQLPGEPEPREISDEEYRLVVDDFKRFVEIDAETEINSLADLLAKIELIGEGVKKYVQKKGLTTVSRSITQTQPGKAEGGEEYNWLSYQGKTKENQEMVASYDDESTFILNFDQNKKFRTSIFIPLMNNQPIDFFTRLEANKLNKNLEGRSGVLGTDEYYYPAENPQDKRTARNYFYLLRSSLEKLLESKPVDSRPLMGKYQPYRLTEEILKRGVLKN